MASHELVGDKEHQIWSGDNYYNNFCLLTLSVSIGILQQQSYLAFVTFEQLIFPLNCDRWQNFALFSLHLSIFTQNFQCVSFLQVATWFSHYSQKTSMTPSIYIDDFLTATYTGLINFYLISAFKQLAIWSIKLANIWRSIYAYGGINTKGMHYNWQCWINSWNCLKSYHHCIRLWRHHYVHVRRMTQ